ncbi:FtsX-like permease family protein [Dehalococcoides mccartyi]|nr:FtsX-like permease family protein [Dehalococcoides mccartyi]
MTAILAGAPMYLSSIESLGLRSTLFTLSASHRNMQVVVDQLPLTNISVTAATERVEVALDELGDLVVNVGQQSQTRPHFWAIDAESITGGSNPDFAILHRFDNFLEEVDLIAGRAPESAIVQTETHVIAEVVVPAKRAETLNVGLGDEIWLSPSPADPPYLSVKIVGLFEPKDIDAEFWLGLGPEILEPGRPSPGAREMLPLLFTRDGLFNSVTGGSASIGTNRWLIELDPVLLERQSPAFTAEQVSSVGHELRRGLPESRAISALENPLKALGEKISFARIPTLMMGGVLLLAAGYYSIMAAGALASRRRVDTARMWARGSERRQISLLFFFESLLLVLLPAIVAPLLAYGVINLIGLLPEYESITLGSGMPVHLSIKAFVWSLIGAVVVILYMQWIVLKDGGRTINSDQISNRRVEGKPFFQRQYLDLLFFLFGGVILWDLSTESSVATVKEGGEAVVTVNPLLIFAPAIFLGVAVMLSLRVLPPIARLVSSVLARRGPAWAHLISALFARVPLTYAWPAAILGMAAGTAMLSATVAATLQQGAVDQSGYEVGADLRIFPIDLSSGSRSGILDSVRGIDGVEGVSSGLRTTGDIRIGGQGTAFEFLAIEPSEFTKIGVFRDDYAETNLVNLISSLDSSVGLEPLMVPEEALRIGYRMRPGVLVDDISASIRILDADGLSHSVMLGAVRGTSWYVRMGNIPQVARRPVEVVGLTFFELTPDELGTPVSIQIDDLMYELPTSELVILDSFDDDSNLWNPLASSQGVDTGTQSIEYSRTIDGQIVNSTGLQVDLGIGTDLGVRGAVRSSSEVVPILFSEAALLANDVAVGETTVIHVFNRSIPVEIIGISEYFPTLNPVDGGFVVVDISQLWAHLALSSANSAGVAQEIFVGLEDSYEASTIELVSSTIGGLHSVVDRADIQRSSVVTPLAVAGWRGTSIVTAVLAIVLAVFGFLTFAPMRPAGDQFNLAVLKTLGVRKRVLVLISVIEQLVILVVGVAAGVGTGLVMARIAVDTASQTDVNINLLPPIVFSTNWNYVAGLIVALAVVAALVSIFDSIAVRRLNVASTVRSSGKSG